MQSRGAYGALPTIILLVGIFAIVYGVFIAVGVLAGIYLVVLGALRVIAGFTTPPRPAAA